jgi:isoleucyl-tRNA synthetase
MTTINLQNIENDIFNFWNENQIFKKTLENSKSSPLFNFYDGPPFATGSPHYGHILAATIKDTVCRFQTINGHYVPRINGWDMHGLPI